MSRQADPLKAAVISDLVKHLKTGADISLVRVKYHRVAKQTWSRWLQEARAAVASGNVSKTVPNGTAKKAEKVPEKKKRGRPTKAETQAKARAAAPPLEGELLDDGKPRFDDGGDGDGDQMGGKRQGIGRLTDEGTYIVMTMFGPKESSVITRFIDKPDLDPHKALGLLDRMSEKYLDAEALMHAQIKAAGDGHVILDTTAYKDGVELQRKILMDMLKILERSRNLDSLQHFMGAIIERIQKESPEIALPVIKALREAAQPFSSRTWQQPIASPTK